MSLSGRSAPPPPVLARDVLVRQQVVVTLIDGSGFRGVLWQADASGFTLTAAAGELVMHCAAGSVEWQPVDGQVFVLAEMVHFVQVPGG
ncbi:MAG: hypothetical protein ACRCW4_13440 [Candidatus Neomicrothrix subdominans]